MVNWFKVFRMVRKLVMEDKSTAEIQWKLFRRFNLHLDGRTIAGVRRKMANMVLESFVAALTAEYGKRG